MTDDALAHTRPSDALPATAQVIVVGGGPAGASAAWHCAQAGLSVLLLDRAHFPRPKVCAEYVSPEAARILENMGALDILQPRAAALTGMEVTTPAGYTIRGEFIAQHGFRGFRDTGLGIRREVLDTVLLNRARAAGVHVIEGAKVEDVIRDDNHRVIGLTVRTVAGLKRINSTLVIGADGLRSTVAHRLGVAHRARWPRRLAFVAHYRGLADMTSRGEMHVTSNGYVGLADVGDGITNVAVVVPANRVKNTAGNPNAFFTEWLNHTAIAPRLASAERVSEVAVTGPFASRASKVWVPGAVLVGDAADFFDPFTGEGIYAALRGGELLAPYAARVVCATADNNAAEARRALAAYRRARQVTFGGKWRVERLISSAVASPPLMNLAGRVLSNDKLLADTLVGVTGDFVPPSVLLKPRMLVRLTWGLLRYGIRLQRHPAPLLPVPDHVSRR